MLLKFFQPIKEKPDLPHSVNRVEVANWYEINFSQGRTELNHDKYPRQGVSGILWNKELTLELSFSSISCTPAVK